MLTPDYLKDIPENIVKLYQDLEDFIIADFARRVKKAGEITTTAKWQIVRAKEIGLSLTSIKKKIKEILKITDKELDKLFKDSAIKSMEYEDIYHKAAGKEPIELDELPELLEYVNLASKQTKGEFYNLTQSLGFAEIIGGKVIYKPIAKYYQDALDFAHFQISSGVIDYNAAIRNAVKKLVDSGIRYVDYDSGWSNKVDVAARRAILTGVNQMSNKLSEMYADKMDCDFVETTAHSGARPSHSIWQGKVFCRSGKSKEYPDFVSSTGYGTGPGLGGWNCRHGFHAFYPGISIPTYTKEQLKNIDPPPFEYKGKTYTYYEATQKQRQLERNIRKTKMELIGYKNAGLKDDFTAASIKLNRQKEAYKEFSKVAKIRPKNDRTQLYEFDKSISQKAVWANKKAL